MVFLELESESRTDRDYANYSESNQVSVSTLLGLVELQSGFPPDYIHCVCLGCVRKLLRVTLLPANCRLPARQIALLDQGPLYYNRTPNSQSLENVLKANF
jgi:hypothetical protein